MNRLIIILFLAFSCLCTSALADDQLKFYSETMAFVNWINVSPNVDITPEDTPRSFTAVVTRAGKLKSFGLPVRLGDTVTIKATAAHTFKVSNDNESVLINTMGKIPIEFYPQYQ